MAMVGGISRTPLVLEVNPGVPLSTVPALVAYAKANPDKITLASYGTGSTSHVAGELFKMMAGIKMLHVPYRGSAPMVTDLIGGQIQAAFDNLPASIEHIKMGKLKALAMTSATRLETLSSVPTVGEFLPGYEASVWIGIGAPKGTSPEIVDKLNKEINFGLGDSNMKTRLAGLGGVAFVSSPGDLDKLLAQDTEKWGKVIRAANIKLNSG